MIFPLNLQTNIRAQQQSTVIQHSQPKMITKTDTGKMCNKRQAEE